MRLRHLGLITGLTAFLLLPASWAQVMSSDAEPVFAIVNDQTISQKEFQSTYANYMRKTYYHRKVPEAELASSLEVVKNQMIDRILLLSEAKRRGLEADEQSIARTVAEYDVRYADSERWKKNRDALLVGVKQQLREQSLLEQIEKHSRTIPDPAENKLLEYYQANLRLFTEPEKLHMHTILLKVDPSASKEVWDAAREEAQRILKNISAGASFEEMARLHSNDVSAEKGGDMGYLHKGMIPESVQVKIEECKPGGLTPPIAILEGIAVFRLDERIASKLQPFENAKTRARDLMKRELSDSAWEKFRLDLRKGAEIKFTITSSPESPVPSR